jgi:hypothetical protein
LLKVLSTRVYFFAVTSEGEVSETVWIYRRVFRGKGGRAGVLPGEITFLSLGVRGDHAHCGKKAFQFS